MPSRRSLEASGADREALPREESIVILVLKLEEKKRKREREISLTRCYLSHFFVKGLLFSLFRKTFLVDQRVKQVN